MNLPLLGLLDGISPIWWLAAGLILIGLRLVVSAAVLIWPAVAALFVSIAIWLNPPLSGLGQIGLFALFTLVLLIAARAVQARSAGAPFLGGRTKREADELVGREAVVENFHWHEGQVSIDGDLWPARLDGRKSPEVGEEVRVIATDGLVVWVRRKPRPTSGSDEAEVE
ncbi:MAG: NfeD family protein [Pseudomonadota bacterium]